MASLSARASPRRGSGDRCGQLERSGPSTVLLGSSSRLIGPLGSRYRHTDMKVAAKGDYVVSREHGDK